MDIIKRQEISKEPNSSDWSRSDKMELINLIFTILIGVAGIIISGVMIWISIKGIKFTPSTEQNKQIEEIEEREITETPPLNNAREETV